MSSDDRTTGTLPEPAATGPRIVVVGASLAGLRVAEALRSQGHTGPLTLVGDENCLPYDRPPLSKQVLSGDWDAERVALTDPGRLAEAGIEVRLGSAADSLTSQVVTLADGTSIPYDRLVIATGASSRTWPGTDGTTGRVHRLRTLSDSLSLRDALAGDGPLTVVGGGFIGLEIAAAARKAGIAVTVLEMAETPLAPVLGDLVGAYFRRLHERHGVDLRTGVAVSAIDEGPDSVRVSLADGTTVKAPHVVVGIGAAPNTGWLSGLGLDHPGGVPCDRHGQAAPGVWALGDVATWEDAVFDDHRRHEHWTSAVEQAAVVAASILGAETRRPLDLPYFWSLQHDVNFQLAGRPDLADSTSIIQAGPDTPDGTDRGTVFGYHRGDRLVAVAAFHNPGRFLKLRRELQATLATERAPV